MRKWTVFLLAACIAIAGAAWSVPGNPLEGLPLLKDAESMRSSSCDPNWTHGNGDARPIAPGATLTIADLEGPGQVTHFWNTIASQERGYSKLLILRMYWDGEEQPSVETPVGDFFGIGHGVDQPFQSLPVTVSADGRARNCYWPMPFRKSAKITVTNEGRKRVDAFYYYVDWQKLPKMPRGTAYFHAMYRQEFPAKSGVNYLLADIEGRGHYIGTVLSVRQRTASWWGEGDDFFFIDGAMEPQLRGTGSEDYLCDAWGLRPMATPYYGAPLMQGYDAFALTSAYRWHIPDPVHFRKSLRVEIEHKGVTFNEDGSIKSGFEERPDDFSSVAFWYQVEPHKPFPAMPLGYERLYVDYSKTIEAESLLPGVTSTSIQPTLQEGAHWSGGGQLFWTEHQPEQSVVIPFDLGEAATYDLMLILTHSFNYGVFEFVLDGKPLGPPLDLYNSAVTMKEHLFPRLELAAGRHELTVRNKGKHPDSKGYFMGLDGMLFGK
jgi:hypothetical protein